MAHPRHSLLQAAYLYYYATDTAFVENADDLGLLKRRLTDLVSDAIILADQARFDVFNAVTLMDNPLFLLELKVRVSGPRTAFCSSMAHNSQFGSGDGLLNFYLYNWRSKVLAGMNPTDDRTAGRGVGVVML